MGRIVIAMLIVALGTPAQAAALSRYCDLHRIPDGRPVVVVTGKPIVVERAPHITNTDVLDAERFREALADTEPSSVRAAERINAEELARFIDDDRLRARARQHRVAVSAAEIDVALTGLERTSHNPPGELKARLAVDDLYGFLRQKVEAALLGAKLHRRPFVFPYRISPPPPCPLVP